MLYKSNTIIRIIALQLYSLHVFRSKSYSAFFLVTENFLHPYFIKRTCCKLHTFTRLSVSYIDRKLITSSFNGGGMLICRDNWNNPRCHLSPLITQHKSYASAHNMFSVLHTQSRTENNQLNSPTVKIPHAASKVNL